MVNFNPDQDIVWGIMVMNYYFLKGIAAGIFFLISVGEVFKIEKLRKFTRMGLWITFATSFMLPLILVSDLGQPSRFFQLIYRPNWESPMAWGAWILTTYFICGALTTYFYMREDLVNLFNYHHKRKTRFIFFFKFLTLNRMGLEKKDHDFDEKALYYLFRFNLLIAFLLELYAGVLLSVNISRPLWNSPLIPLIFMSSAVISGSAALVIIYSTYHLIGNRHGFDRETVVPLVKVMFFAIIAEFFFLLLQILYFDNSTNRAEFQYIFLFNQGFETLGFIFFDFGIGLIVPFLLLVIPGVRNKFNVQLLATVFALIGAGIYKYNLVIGGQELSRTSNVPIDVNAEFKEFLPMISLYLAYFAALLAVFWYFPWKEKFIFKSETKSGTEEPAK